MRRRLLAAVLVAPALAAAQTTIGSGAIQFTDGTTDTLHGGYINLLECQGNVTSGPFVNLSWNTKLNSGVTGPGTFKYNVYASNKESTAPNCITGPVGTDTRAAAVGVTLTGEAQTVNLKSFPTSAFVTAAGYDCSVTADTTLFVCVQAYDGTPGTTNTSPIGYAKGTLTLSTSKPASPSGVTAVPADDGALKVSWAAPSGDPQAYDYRLIAAGAGDTSNHQTIVTGTSTTVTGLINGVPYTFSVWARSPAGNESDTPGTGTGTPVPVANFWDVYHGTYGGREQGGCSAGSAGPVALLGVAALLAALRRRK